MKPAAFGYDRPADWPAALALLAAGARPAAGGQSLGPMLNLRLAQPESLADLRHLPGYAGVAVADGIVRIGAGTTHATIEDGAVPGRLGAILAGVARRIAYRPVRNRGTMGGSLAHADPAADWVSVLPAFAGPLGGHAVALGPAGERRIPLDGFMLGLFETALAPGELLRAVELPVLPEATRWGHWKFCRKTGEFSKATACLLAVPGAAPRAVLAALDAPPLVLPDATALLADPEGESERLVAGLDLADPWRAAIARTALRRAAAGAAA
ncbi:FAD binding domain-containing protein [Roseomonas sp. NAR14]|uniref:FAD binding domain-containing protein n=1 Tax=Roseomonas acroporae TaxID=2937791 RepID=A0A9X2BW29_9PROT|nr:FAD binding domain-containing protein [Roseomonas acroporae]MCK8787302.1 FAD binding domain-containing protein [Roseomonas acroporae]